MNEGLTIPFPVIVLLIVYIWFFIVLRPTKSAHTITCPGCGRFNWKYIDIDGRKGHLCKTCGVFLEDR